jgi:5-formyltetrahydrofolate cyclo-ligase
LGGGFPDALVAKDQSAKAGLRAAALAARDALSGAERRTAAKVIADRGLPVPLPAGATVSGFMPIGAEINPLPLMKRLAEAGAHLALPVVMGRGEPLVMRAWMFGAPLIQQMWNIRIPPPEAPAIDPDLLIVPLACFDRTGQRIGYGAGYYDRTIAALRATKAITAIGVAYAVQQVPAVPATPFDQPLDFVMTERETIDCRGAANRQP